MSLVDLSVNSWKELISIIVQGVVVIITTGIAPWFGYKTFVEKNKIEKAEKRLSSKTAELNKIRKISQAAKLNIEFYRKKNSELQENLLNIQIRTEAALEFTEIFYTTSEKLSAELIEQTPSTVINHLSSLRDQVSRQQRQLDSYYNIFKEILVFSTIEDEQ